LHALFGIPMSGDDRALYERCTGRTDVPDGGAREAWLVVGRRGGKSMVLALIAVFLACFCNWAPFLSPGEGGTIVVLAADRRQARVAASGHGRNGIGERRNGILRGLVGVRRGLLRLIEYEIDLGEREAGGLDVEFQIDER
jgi:hypothetical protein